MTPSPTRSLHRARGFSLVELLLVLALIGVLAAIAAPSFTGWIRSIRASSAADRLAADLALARVIAVRDGWTTSLRIEGAGVYQITRDDVNGAPVDVLLETDLRDDYPGVNVSPSGTRIAFDSRGILRSAGDWDTTIIIYHNGGYERLTVSQVGRVLRED
jgi:type II secretion system protein H